MKFYLCKFLNNRLIPFGKTQSKDVANQWERRGLDYVSVVLQ